jgi:hypothetical protein
MKLFELESRRVYFLKKIKPDSPLKKKEEKGFKS